MGNVFSDTGPIMRALVFLNSGDSKVFTINTRQGKNETSTDNVPSGFPPQYTPKQTF